MNDTRLISAVALTVALLMAPAGAATFDDSKYPDLKGQWDRIGAAELDAGREAAVHPGISGGI